MPFTDKKGRDGGFFSSQKPTGDGAILSKALRQRKTAGSGEAERSRDVKGKGKAKEEVVLEKSNVLMMYVRLHRLSNTDIKWSDRDRKDVDGQDSSQDSGCTICVS